MRTISLSAKKYSLKFAEELKDVVRRLIYNRENGIDILDKKTQSWIEMASPAIQEKLAKVDLILIPEQHTALELWNEVLRVKEAEGIADNGLKNYGVALQRFFTFFNRGQDRLITEFTKEQMLEWKQTMLRQSAPATVACTMTRAKTVFNWAVKNGWLLESPLKGVGRGSYINRSRDREITMEEYQKLLAACPSTEWKAIIALARIGGLRAPSEVLRLRWADILWGKHRFCVTSLKTARYGRPKREVPLFPKLRTVLEELLSESDGEEYVINIYRSPETNLGTMFARIAKRAGLDVIPRPFDNMRASRATEIYCEYGAYYESLWIGHHPSIAKDHYIMVREWISPEPLASRWNDRYLLGKYRRKPYSTEDGSLFLLENLL